MHRLIKILTSRLIIVGILILIQAVYLFTFFYRFTLTYKLDPFIKLISIILAVYVFNRTEDSEYKMVWCISILAMPIIGIPLYILCGGKKMPKKLYEGTTQASNILHGYLSQGKDVISQINEKDPTVNKIFQYALNTSNYPVYDNTEAKFFKSGEEMYPYLLSELRKAEKFIFIESFIIDEGKVWNAILEILKEKVKQGVDVKVIYDDFGCSTTLPRRYDKQLGEYGIEALRFNPMRPALIIQMNNRDHRKICVIDNKVGFTGGVNLADEYMNFVTRFGYWRDSAIMLKGEAVWSLTDMFLGMYSSLMPDDQEPDYEQYHYPCEDVGYHGFFQPFSDTPTDEADVGLSMHLNLIKHAKDYIYINTPYLVLNADMVRALTLAAETGVDVRILVPHIPDKNYVFSITKSNYEELLLNGVRIYEFTPGFNHDKSFVVDDELALVGSINTDYRSYFLHFEDGVLMYDSPEILRIRENFEDALRRSHEVTLTEVRETNIVVRMYRAFLRLLAPLF